MKLTAENYHSLEANKAYMSASQYRDFFRCPARAMALIDGRWIFERTPSMTVSAYIDAYFSGTLEQFKAANPQIYKRDGGLRSEYFGAEEIIERIQRDPLMMEYLSGNWQTILTGEIEGVPFKIKMDSFFPGQKIVDLKVMANFNKAWSDEQHKYVSWIQAWGYDYQAAIYREVTGGGLPVYIAAATKEKPADIQVTHMTPDILDNLIDEVKYYAPEFQAIKLGLGEPTRCEICDYCRVTKKLKNPVEYIELMM